MTTELERWARDLQRDGRRETQMSGVFLGDILALLDERDALRSENATMVQALKKIANHPTGTTEGDLMTTAFECWACAEIVEIATRALKEKE